MQHFTGKQYLMIDIANNFGLDDQQYDVRLNWFKENEHHLESLVRDAEEPAQFLAGVMAWRDTLAGIPTGYMVGHDACASGIQILAALSGCKTSARNCGLTGQKRQDIYTNAYAWMNEKLNTVGTLVRKVVKLALMTSMYGSQRQPKDAFGEGTTTLEMFYKMQDVILPGVRALRDDIQTLWQPFAADHSWTLADGYDVVIKVMEKVTTSVPFLGQHVEVDRYVNQGTEKGISLVANVTHSVDGMVVREMGRRCNYDREQVEALLSQEWLEAGTRSDRKIDRQLLRVLDRTRASGFMSMVLVEYLDAENYGHLTAEEHLELQCLLKSLVQHKPFSVVCVHDCFKCHANNMNWVRWHYIEIFSQIARSNMMSDIASQITGGHITVAKLSDDLHEEILHAEYPLS
jgi:hypothetical protein